MKNIEKIAAGIALVAGLGLATCGYMAKENTINEKTVYGTAGLLVGLSAGVFTINYLNKK